jgi:hypothetical protein
MSLANYQPADALLLFHPDQASNDRVSPQQTVTIESIDTTPGHNDVIVTEALVAGLTAAKWLYNGRKLEAGGVTAGATELHVIGALASQYPKDSWAYVTDGTGVNELYGEFVRVLDAFDSVGRTTLILESGVRNSYIDDRAAIIPPGRWVENLTIRNLTLGGMYNYGRQSGTFSAKFLVNARLEGIRCEVAVAGLVQYGFGIVTSGHVAVSDCGLSDAEGLLFNSSRDVVVERTRAVVQNEEFCSDITYCDCDIVKYYLHILGCVRMRAVRCRFWNISSFGFDADCSLIRCDVHSPVNAFWIGGERCTIRDLQCFDGNLVV